MPCIKTVEKIMEISFLKRYQIMVRRECYFYTIIGGLPPFATRDTIINFLYQRGVIFQKVEYQSIPGTFKISDTAESKVQDLEFLMKLNNYEIMVGEGEKYKCFLAENKEIRIQFMEDIITTAHIRVYMDKHGFPKPDVVDTGNNTFYLYSPEEHSILTVEYHLEQLRNNIKFPHLFHMIRFQRNEETNEDTSLKRFLEDILQEEPMMVGGSKEASTQTAGGARAIKGRGKRKHKEEL
uniref:DUF4364 family protein n=1 Tax=Strongyloides papillosus TaxID=174720 RepID=A0A0N5BE33_STREA